MELSLSEAFVVKALSEKIEIMHRPDEKEKPITSEYAIICVLKVKDKETFFLCETDGDIREIFDKRWPVIEWRFASLSEERPSIDRDGLPVIMAVLSIWEPPDEFWVIKSEEKILVGGTKNYQYILAFGVPDEAKRFAQEKGIQGIPVKVSRAEIESLAASGDFIIQLDIPPDRDIELGFI